MAALGRMIACYLMRARYVRCMDALGPRLERVSTVNRALARVFWHPCALLVGARSRWARNTFSRPPGERICCTWTKNTIRHMLERALNRAR